jgi:hypothetical protein
MIMCGIFGDFFPEAYSRDETIVRMGVSVILVAYLDMSTRQYLIFE